MTAAITMTTCSGEIWNLLGYSSLNLINPPIPLGVVIGLSAIMFKT